MHWPTSHASKTWLRLGAVVHEDLAKAKLYEEQALSAFGKADGFLRAKKDHSILY